MDGLDIIRFVLVVLGIVVSASWGALGKSKRRKNGRKQQTQRQLQKPQPRPRAVATDRRPQPQQRQSEPAMAYSTAEVVEERSTTATAATAMVHGEGRNWNAATLLAASKLQAAEEGRIQPEEAVAEEPVESRRGTMHLKAMIIYSELLRPKYEEY